MSRKSSSCFLLVGVGLLMLFSPCAGKAQNNSTECKWVYKYVWAQEYNPATKQTELQYVHRPVFECPPIPANTNSTISSSGNSNSESTKKPIEPRTTPSKTGTSTKLKEGTYEIKAKEGMFEESTKFKIKIESVGATGEVKARLYKSGDEGPLKGRVDSDGQLLLEGFLVYVIKGLGKSEYGFKLKANVEDDVLINGKYRITFGKREWDGTLDKGTLEEF